MKIRFTFFFLLLLGHLQAQNITSYAFTAVSNASLSTDMTGSTVLIPANSASLSSEVTSIGFNFVFMGKVYTRFSVNTNGVLRFGEEPVLAEANTYGIPGNDRIAVFAVASAQRLNWWWENTTANMATHSNGQVHVKVLGSAPNRYLVIEWKNMQIPAGSGSADGTFQLRLYESAPGSNAQAGTLELVYGAMKVGTNRRVSYRIGFGIGPEAGNFYSVNAGTASLSETTDYANGPQEGNITALSSTDNTSRKAYRFVANRKPSGSFSDINILCMAANSISIGFQENSTEEAGIAVYRKLKSEADTQFRLLQSLSPDARSFTDGSIALSTQYVYRFYLLGEGAVGASFVDFEPGTIPSGKAFQAVVSGRWSNPATWGGRLPADKQDISVGCSGTIYLTADASAIINNLTIERGSFFTLEDGQTLEVQGNFINKGVFSPQGNARILFTGGQDQLIVNEGQGKADDSRFVSSTANTSWGDEATGKVAEKLITINDPSFLAVKEVRVDIQHAYLRDLSLYLRTPDGSRYKLAENRGQRGVDYQNVSFTDFGEPLPPSTRTVNLSGNYQPEERFSAYSGPMQGNWVLEVEDRMIDVGGTLTTFELVLSKASSNNLELESLEIDKPTGGVYLEHGLIINKSLKLTKGILHSAAGKAITFEQGASVNEGNPQSFIAGPVIKKGTEDFTFPLGKGGKWAPLAISNLQNANQTTCFQAEYYPTENSEADRLNSELTNISTEEYWELSPLEGTASVNITLFWKNNSGEYIEDFMTDGLVVAHFTGGQWMKETSEIAVGSNLAVGGSGSVTAYNISTFSPFTLGSTIEPSGFPVELLDFTAERSSEGVELRWVTLSETHNSHFELERSLDGKSFAQIARVEGHGTTLLRQTYAFTDTQAPLARVYYRFRQVDFDGQWEYSPLLSVDNRQAGRQQFSLYPNPSRTNDKLQLDLRRLPAGDYFVEILTLQGKSIAQYTCQASGIAILELKDIKAGNYLLRLQNEQQYWVKKLIVD